MRTKEEIKNHPGFDALVTKAQALDSESRDRLVAMFKNEGDIPFLASAEEGVIFNVLKGKIGAKATRIRGALNEELSHNRNLMVEILLEELEGCSMGKAVDELEDSLK